MDENTAMKLLKYVGCDKISSGTNGWIRSTCPFARWTHSSGTDSTPSFGVNLDGGFGYNCFSCGKKGRGAHNLVWSLQSLNKSADYTEASNLIRDGNYESFNFNSDSLFSKWDTSEVLDFRFGDGQTDELHPVAGGPGLLFGDYEEVKRESLPESVLDDFEKMHHQYLLKRGFSKEIIEKWELVVDIDRLGNERIVFPIRDIDGRLLAFSKRVTWDRPKCQVCGYEDPPDTPKEKQTIKFGSRRDKGDPREKGGCPRCKNRWVWPKYQHSKGFKRNLYLYGEHHIDCDFNKGVVVEGNLDVVRLDQFGVRNCVATLGTNVGMKWPTSTSPGEQMYRLTQYFNEVVLAPDGDKAGQKMLNDVASFFKGMEDIMWVNRLTMPSGKDPGELTRSEAQSMFGPFGVLKKGRAW